MHNIKPTMIILDKLFDDKQYKKLIDFFEYNLLKLNKIPSSFINIFTLSLLKMVKSDFLLLFNKKEYFEN